MTDLRGRLSARRLGVASAFKALSDTFSAYLCLVVAPWVLARALVAADGSAIREALIGLPLVTGAMRYARISFLIVGEGGEVRELSGLGDSLLRLPPGGGRLSRIMRGVPRWSRTSRRFYPPRARR